MTQQQVPIRDWFSQSFDLYKSSAKVLIPGGLLGLLAVAVPGWVLIMILPGVLLDQLTTYLVQGVLSGPIFAGLYLMASRVRKGDGGVKIPDVFRGFDYAVPTFAFAFGLILFQVILGKVLGIVPVLGVLLALVISIVVSLLVAFTVPILVEQKLSVPDAIRASVEKVKQNALGFACFFLLSSLAAVSGVILFGVGLLVTAWFIPCAAVVAYANAFDSGSAADGKIEAATPAPEPPPPPPAATPDGDSD